MTVDLFTAVQTAAVAAFVLSAGVAGFQLALAAGLPLGDAVFGGNAQCGHTHSGTTRSSSLNVIARSVQRRSGPAANP